MAVMTDKAALQKLEQAYTALSAKRLTGADACAGYKMSKPAMVAVLLFVGRIPVWGKYAEKVIRASMAAADAACG